MQIPITFIPNEDGGYTAICNIFPVITEGDTIEEAEFNIVEAISCHLEGLKKEEKSSPELYKQEISFINNIDRAKHQILSFA